jgi:predicted Rossmann fold nucleotide-binding protein DprA/Smf involved in DNA uptake
LVRHPHDVLEALWPELLAPRARGAGAAEDAPATSGRGVPPGPAGELLAALPTAVEIAPEEAAARARRPVAQALAELLELELGGWVRRLPGPAYVRVP